jgi:hypothetical protein
MPSMRSLEPKPPGQAVHWFWCAMTVLCAYFIVRTLERNEPSGILFATEACALIVCVVLADLSYPGEPGTRSPAARQRRSEEF